MACHFNRHMYVSHTLSSMVSDNQITSGKHGKQEIGDQIALNRLYDRMDAPGSCWYSFSTGMTTKDFFNYIGEDVNARPAVIPQMTWMATNDCYYVSNIRVEGNLLKWEAPKENLRFVVYQIPTSEVGQHGAVATSRNVLGTTYTNSFSLNNKFVSDGTMPTTYAVAVLDRFGNEHPARTMDNTQWGKSPKAEIVYPANNAATVMPCNVSWKAVEGADSYFFQLSKSADFSTFDYEYEVSDTTFYLGKVYWLNQDGTYYWRVRTRSINKEDSFTDIHAFDGSYFRMQSPAEGDTCDFHSPTFVCDSISFHTVEYTFEIASNTKFDANSIVHVATSSTHRYTLPFDLLASRDYYVRVIASFNGMQVMCKEVKFRTMAQFVPVPIITSPANGTHFAGNDVTVTWKEQASSGFQVEFSQKSNFPPRSTTKVRVDNPTVFTCTKTGLSKGTWYIRVSAVAEGGLTEPSAVVTVYMGSTTDLGDVSVDTNPIKVLENGQVYILRNGVRYNLLGRTAQ